MVRLIEIIQALSEWANRHGLAREDIGVEINFSKRVESIAARQAFKSETHAWEVPAAFEDKYLPEDFRYRDVAVKFGHREVLPAGTYSVFQLGLPKLED